MDVPGIRQDLIHGLCLEGPLTIEQAKAIFARGEEAVVFALLQLSKLAAQQHQLASSLGNADDPSCPSGQKPVFTKPNKPDKKRGKKSGRRKGHLGSRRKSPASIDRTVEHRAECCPDCGGKLQRCSGVRERLIEDLPEDVRIETVRHVIHRDWCPACRKAVEPIIREALPKAAIGNGILVLCAWLHFALGNTISAKHLGVNTKGTIVRGGSEHLIVTVGLEDCIVVHTPDATLVAIRRDEESLRRVVELLRERGCTEYL